MNWITDKIGTASLKELEILKKLKDVEIELVMDLIDGEQINKGQFMSKISHIEKAKKKEKKEREFEKRGEEMEKRLLLKEKQDWLKAGGKL